MCENRICLTQGAFHLSELAGRTITGPVSKQIKSAFSKGSLVKNHLLRAYCLGFDWPGWIVLIRSEILITTGMVWPVSSDKWKAPSDSLSSFRFVSFYFSRSHSGIQFGTPLSIWARETGYHNCEVSITSWVSDRGEFRHHERTWSYYVVGLEEDTLSPLIMFTSLYILHTGRVAS